MTDLRTWVLSNCNFLIGFKPDPKTDIFIRAEHFGFRRKNPESWKGLFDNLLLDTVYAHNSTTTVGAEVIFPLFRLLFSRNLSHLSGFSSFLKLILAKT